LIEIKPTPIESAVFRGRQFFIKRDDLTHPDFSGNKARKFYYYLVNEFPQIRKVISYGSNQSNAMYSLSVLSKMKGWKAEYFVNHIPSNLLANPRGNYGHALKNGMKIIEGKPRIDIAQNQTTLFIPEGGRCKEAEVGIKVLSQEILQWAKTDINIFLPSGTGATALYLQKNLPFKVFTCACVGDENYLKKQFLELEKNENFHPTILTLKKKYHYGKLYPEFYKIWIELKKSIGIEFDLLYDPLGWLTLLEHLDIIKEPILYIHQGGLLGNETLLERYKRKFELMAY
jgi:1-aminocyclopropane-1-carboxylate deaminase/D-cysteine desulfhydrase-like pyridoxal-dependent ACC family enzyme